MNISQIGYGTYRVSHGVPQHEESLKKALLGGINLVDTSSNYTNGNSELLIGKVLKDLEGRVDRKTLTIVSKYGYIQGDNLARQRNGLTFPETVPYESWCYHCIHPDFMRDQLIRSLERLGLDYLDIYLIHNPEYYLMDKIGTEKDLKDREKHQEEMLRRIGEAFNALEKEVQAGRIHSYGISSNSFGKREDDPHFIPYAGLIELAEEAARKAGNNAHSFRAVQMPGNLLELEGLEKCAPWAQKHELLVFINRPLNAQDKNGLHRLADYEAPDACEDFLNKTLGHFEKYGPDPIRKILAEMAQNPGMFSSIAHYEMSLNRYIIPVLQAASGDLKQDEMEAVNNFLDIYELLVRARSSKKIREYLSQKGYLVEGPMEEYALKFLLNRPSVSCVLLGMKSPEYVETALKLMQERRERGNVRNVEVEFLQRIK